MKKYIAIALTIIVVAVIGISLSNPKNSNTMYEFDSEVVSAETYYEMMIENYGHELAFQFLEKSYLETLEVSDDIKSMSKLQAQAMLTEETTDEEKAAITESLVALGYKGINDLEIFFQHSNMRREMIAENYSKYIDLDTLVADFKPRLVTHVLVLATQDEKDHEQAKAPTKEEKQLMDKVDAVLKDSKDIKLDMIKVSDSETIIGENLGYVDINTQLVESFLVEALKTKEKTISGWVKSSFGYHRIYVESTSINDFGKSDDFISAIQEYDKTLSYKIMLGVMKESGVTINQDFEAKLLKGLEG